MYICLVVKVSNLFDVKLQVRCLYNCLIGGFYVAFLLQDPPLLGLYCNSNSCICPDVNEISCFHKQKGVVDDFETCRLSL